MKNVVTRAFRGALVATASIVVVGVAASVALCIWPPSETQLKLFQFLLEIFKVVLAGFVVSMLGILIPAVATEARDRFQQRKDSRIAYSKAKTANDYLRLRLASADFTTASKILQYAHFLKHQAELFDDFQEWLERRFTYIDYQAAGHSSLVTWWDDVMYKRLSMTRKLLETNAHHWESLTYTQRMQLLSKTLPVI